MKMQQLAIIPLIAASLSVSAADQPEVTVKDSANQAASLIQNGAALKTLKRTKSQMKLQAEIMKLSNEIKKARWEGDQIGKEPKDDEKEDSNKKVANDITYYPPPQPAPQKKPVEPEEKKTADSSASKTDYRGLKHAQIQRTFRKKGKDEREAVILLRGKTVPVVKGDYFGNWKVIAIQSGLVRFKHKTSNETLVVGF